MAQEMTLTVYLQQRGKKAKALTRIEAEVFGIPFPLLAGWPRRHGAMLITAEMIERIAVLAATTAQSTNQIARRGGQRVATLSSSAARVAATVSSTARSAAAAPSFPGFALRCMKRRRVRAGAPRT